MRSKRLFLGLGLLLACLLVAEQAGANAWCTTRSNCRSWAQRFTANAHVGCIGLSLPLCYRHAGNCDGTGTLSCGWRSCPVGGGDASASNGWGGCSLWSTRSGLGTAGAPVCPRTRDDDQGGHNIFSHAEFDAAAHTVTIILERGELASLPGGLASRLDVYVLREDPAAKPPADGQELDDPVAMPDNTLWHGSVVLRGGKLAVTGFDPAAFQLVTDGKGLRHVLFEKAVAVQRFDISDADFANLAVQVVADED